MKSVGFLPIVLYDTEKEVTEMMSAVYTPRPTQGFISAHLPKQGWSHNQTINLRDEEEA